MPFQFCSKHFVQQVSSSLQPHSLNATLCPDTLLFHLSIAYDIATELNLQILSVGSRTVSLRLF